MSFVSDTVISRKLPASRRDLITNHNATRHVREEPRQGANTPVEVTQVRSSSGLGQSFGSSFVFLDGFFQFLLCRTSSFTFVTLESDTLASLALVN